MIKLLRDDTELPGGEFPIHVSTKASWALEQIGRPAVPSLLALSSNKDGFLRQRAILALGEIRDGRAIDPLIRALGDKEDYVRESAASSLGHLRDPKAVEPLIALLAKEPLDVMGALGEIGDKRAVPHLIPLLKHEEEFMRQHGAFALEEIVDRRALRPLLALLDDNSFEVRIAAIGAIREFRDPNTVEPLAKLLSNPDVQRRDKDVRLRHHVTRAMVMIGGPRAKRVLRAAAMDDDDTLRLHAEHALDCFETPEALALHRRRGAHSPVALRRRIYDLVNQGDANKLVAAVYPESLTDDQQRNVRMIAKFLLFGHRLRKALQQADEKFGGEVSKPILTAAMESLPKIVMGENLDAMLTRGKLTVNGDHAQVSPPEDLGEVSLYLVAFTRYERIQHERWHIPRPMQTEPSDLKEMKRVVVQFEEFYGRVKKAIAAATSAEQCRTSIIALIRELKLCFSRTNSARRSLRANDC